MARVLLVNPPFYRLLGSHYNSNSLGIAYIAANLNNHGHDAWLYNADYLDRRDFLALKGLFGQFHDYTRYFQDEGAEIWQEVVGKILAAGPEWIGYTSYTANIKAIDIVSRKVKQVAPHIRQVIGGTHATLDKEILEKLRAIDYAVAREGEQAMLDLVEGKDPRTIPGVASRNHLGVVNHNGDADTLDCNILPFPERRKFWHLTPGQISTVDVSYMVTIRGCPYRCNYCASPYSWKRNKVQFRTPDSVLAEMHHLKEHHWNTRKECDYTASANTSSKDMLVIPDNTIVYFVDDVFTVRKPRVIEILERMISEGLNMPWKCEARTDHLTPEICELMAQAGCKRVKLGFESGSDRILKQIQKDETRADMLKGAEMLRAAGVPFTAYFMAGFPGETDEDLRETIGFAREIKADYYSLSVLSPYFGTRMYYDLVEKGYPLDKAAWEYFYHQTGEMLVNTTISQPVLREYLDLNELNKQGKGYV